MALYLRTLAGTSRACYEGCGDANAQLYIALGIPVLLALTNLAVTINLIGKVEGRVDRLETRIDKVEARIDKLEAHTDSRFDKIDADLRRFFELFGRHDEAVETLSQSLATPPKPHLR